MSLRQYAEHRKERGLGGTTLRAVQKAIASNRISTVPDEKGRERIDPAVADIQWSRNTDVDQAARANAPRTAAGAGSAEGEGGGAVVVPAAGEGAQNPYWQAKTRREVAEASKAEIELRALAGELVQKAEVHRAAFDAGRMLRDLILAVPPKVAAELASITDPAVIERRLREELRRPLEQVSRLMRDHEEAA